MLKQFRRDRGKAEKEYRCFVRGEVGKGSIWGEVKGQAIFGGVTFAEGRIDHHRKHKEIAEISKSHRFVGRPGLGKIFAGEKSVTGEEG